MPRRPSRRPQPTGPEWGPVPPEYLFALLRYDFAREFPNGPELAFIDEWLDCFDMVKQFDGSGRRWNPRTRYGRPAPNPESIGVGVFAEWNAQISDMLDRGEERPEEGWPLPFPFHPTYDYSD